MSLAMRMRAAIAAFKRPQTVDDLESLVGFPISSVGIPSRVFEQLRKDIRGSKLPVSMIYGVKVRLNQYLPEHVMYVSNGSKAAVVDLRTQKVMVVDEPKPISQWSQP